MPAFGPVLAIGDVVQIISYAQQADQAGLNILHYKVRANNAASPNLLSDFMASWEALNWGSTLRPLMSSSADYRGYTAQVIHPTPSVAFASPFQQGAGAVAGDLLPRQVAGLIRKRSADFGRRKSGRVYVPFPGEGDNTADSFPSAGYVTRLDNLATVLTNEVLWGAAGRATPAIWNRTASFARNVGAFTTVGRWATQRRRGSFGRPNPVGP